MIGIKLKTESINGFPQLGFRKVTKSVTFAKAHVVN